MSYDGFSFIFFRDSVTENVTENVTERKIPSHQIVLNLLKENPMRSREEMAGIMGKTVRTARAGYWEVIQDQRNAAGILLLMNASGEIFLKNSPGYAIIGTGNHC